MIHVNVKHQVACLTYRIYSNNIRSFCQETERSVGLEELRGRVHRETGHTLDVKAEVKFAQR